MAESEHTDDLIVVRTFAYRHEAELGRSHLEAHSVHAIISGDDAGGMRPWLGASTGIRLLVRQSDAAKAKELLG